MPTLRRKKEAVSAAYNEVLAAVKAEAPVPAVPSPVVQAAAHPEPERAEAAQESGEPQDLENGAESDETVEGRVHRRLIRATLPRTENNQVVRPVPEFTMRQPTGRPGKFRGGMTRGMGSRPGAARGGNVNGNSRTPVFGRTASGRGGGQTGRPVGRNEGHRHPRGGQPARSGKKSSK
jgi:hypothetical protein